MLCLSLLEMTDHCICAVPKEDIKVWKLFTDIIKIYTSHLYIYE